MQTALSTNIVDTQTSQKWHFGHFWQILKWAGIGVTCFCPPLLSFLLNFCVIVFHTHW